MASVLWQINADAVSLLSLFCSAAAFPRLSSLSLHKCCNTNMDAVLLAARELATLADLQLLETTATMLPPLPRLTPVTQLALRNESLTDFAGAIRTLPALRELAVSCHSAWQLGGEFAKAIAAAPQLRRLDCSGQFSKLDCDEALLGGLAVMMRQRGGTLQW